MFVVVRLRCGAATWGTLSPSLAVAWVSGLLLLATLSKVTLGSCIHLKIGQILLTCLFIVNYDTEGAVLKKLLLLLLSLRG